jgi:hypothetical protein
MIKDGFIPGVTAPEGYESNLPAFGAALNDTQTPPDSTAIPVLLEYLANNQKS